MLQHHVEMDEQKNWRIDAWQYDEYKYTTKICEPPLHSFTGPGYKHINFPTMREDGQCPNYRDQNPAHRFKPGLKEESDHVIWAYYN